MNLGELRDELGNVTQQRSASEQARDERTRLLNGCLEQLYGLEQWTFANRVWDIRSVPDITFTVDDWTKNTDHSVAVTASSPSFDQYLTGGDSVANRNWTLSMLQGATIEPPVGVKGSLTELGYGADRFVIESVTFSLAAPSPATLTLWMDPRYALPVAKDGTMTGTWTIRPEAFVVPKDLGQIRAVYWQPSPNTAPVPLSPWTPTDDAFRGSFLPDQLGPPTAWQLEELGHWLSYASSTSAAFLEGDSGNRVTGYQMRAPLRPATAVSSNSSGSLPSSTRIQYVYTWQFAGRESGPSPITEITTGVADDTVALSNLETTTEVLGRYRVIYRRIAEGRWQRIGQVSDSTLATFTDNVGFDPTYMATNPLLDRRLFATGPSRVLRLFPRPADWFPLRVHYQCLPPPLVAATDSPEFPADFHEVLVHMAAVKLLATQNAPDFFKMQRLLVEEILGRMRRRCLADVHQPFVRGGGRYIGPTFTAPIWNG